MAAGPPAGARDREFAAGRVDEVQMRTGRATLTPFAELVRNIPDLAQPGTYHVVRALRPAPVP